MLDSDTSLGMIDAAAPAIGDTAPPIRLANLTWIALVPAAAPR